MLHPLHSLLAVTLALSSSGIGRVAPQSEVLKPDRERFEAIVLDLSSTPGADKIKESVALRFRHASVSLWGPDSKDLSPPFVLVQLKARGEGANVSMRFLTHEGAVYTREITLGPDPQEHHSAIARECTSTLLAIEEGLLEPDPEDSEDPQDPQDEIALPESSSVAPQADPTGGPRPASPQASTLNPVGSGPAPMAETPRWRVAGELLVSASLPLPRFERLFAGTGLRGSALRTLESGLEIGAGLSWQRIKRQSIAVHRAGVFMSVGQRWAVGTQNRAEYQALGLLSVEPWWIRTANPATPRPSGSSVLGGLWIQQALMLRLPAKSARRWRVGPSIRVGYAGLLGRGFSALGVYSTTPPHKDSAVVRIGGLEAQVGVRVEYGR